MRGASQARFDNRLNSRRRRSQDSNKTTRGLIQHKRKSQLSAPGWSDDDREFERELYVY